jgi:hypothetical protein
MGAGARTETTRSGLDQAGNGLFRRPWLLTVILASALCIAYLICVFVNWGNAADRSLYANLGMIPIGLAATILAASAARTQPDRRSRWAWRLLAAALGCFLAGDVLFFVYQNILGRVPVPSLADAGYLAYYPLAFVGLLFFPSLPVERWRRVAAYLCGLVIVGAGAVIIVRLILLPTIHSGHEELFSYSLSVGYPLGDLLLLAGVAWALARRMSEHRLGILLLCAGLVVGLIADVVYGYQNIEGTFHSGGFADAAYMLSWALFGWGGFAQLSPSPSAVTSRPNGQAA